MRVISFGTRLSDHTDDSNDPHHYSIPDDSLARIRTTDLSVWTWSPSSVYLLGYHPISQTSFATFSKTQFPCLVSEIFSDDHSILLLTPSGSLFLQTTSSTFTLSVPSSSKTVKFTACAFRNGTTIALTSTFSLCTFLKNTLVSMVSIGQCDVRSCTYSLSMSLSNVPLALINGSVFSFGRDLYRVLPTDSSANSGSSISTSSKTENKSENERGNENERESVTWSHHRSLFAPFRIVSIGLEHRRGVVVVGTPPVVVQSQFEIGVDQDGFQTVYETPSMECVYDSDDIDTETEAEVVSGENKNKNRKGKGVKRVVSGGHHTILEMEDGSVKGLGSNTYGQLNFQDFLRNGIVDMSCGRWDSVFLIA